MPRKSLGARLYLQPVRRGRGDGKGGEDAVWVIRDGPIKRSTGLPESHKTQAELALADYVAAKPSGKTYFVYFITAKAPNFPIKIGITESRAQRSQCLQTSLPYDVEVLAFIPTTDPILERRLHRRFSEQRLRGEWFERTPELLSTIDELCAEFGGA